MGREIDFTQKYLIAKFTLETVHQFITMFFQVGQQFKPHLAMFTLETVMVLHMALQIFGTGTRLTANHASTLHVHVESMSLQIGLI